MQQHVCPCKPGMGRIVERVTSVEQEQRSSAGCHMIYCSDRSRVLGHDLVMSGATSSPEGLQAAMEDQG